jgi:multiple sugar transport system ATP-binding protein
MRVEIKRLHQQTGTTTVYVTHDQIEAMTLATRIAVLKDGEVSKLVAQARSTTRRRTCLSRTSWARPR